MIPLSSVSPVLLNPNPAGMIQTQIGLLQRKRGVGGMGECQGFVFCFFFNQFMQLFLVAYLFQESC